MGAMSARTSHPAIRSAIGFVFAGAAARQAMIPEKPLHVILWAATGVFFLLAAIQFGRQAMRHGR
jgi:hypothetical protein